jgi:hypothetical protein
MLLCQGLAADLREGARGCDAIRHSSNVEDCNAENGETTLGESPEAVISVTYEPKKEGVANYN